MLKVSSLILLIATVCHGSVQAAATADVDDPGKDATFQKQRDPTVANDTAPASPLKPLQPVQPGAVNPANGQYYPPTGNGDVINPATGERYIGTPGGYINPNTGEFMPKIR